MQSFSMLAVIALVTVGTPAATFAQVAANSNGGNNPATGRPQRPASGLTLVPAQNTSAAAAAVAGNSSLNNLDLPATDPGYQLSSGDEIAVIVWGEGDVSIDQRIDTKGIIRVPLIGDVNLSSKTVREAEKFLEQLFIDKKLLLKPMVTISVRDYAAREVSVLGAVNSPGKYRMPKEAASIEIVELITSLGGFKPTAKSDEVKVTRVDESGIETVSTVNVESMISGRGAGKNTPKSFLVYPGDRIYVPERLF